MVAGVRKGRADAIDEATRFLVADPWCFRSGYLKAELMHALANTTLPGHVVEPLRKVVLDRVVDRQPRLLRYAAQLASNVWSEDFEGQLKRLALEGSPETRVAAEQLIDRARHRIRSQRGQARDRENS